MSAQTAKTPWKRIVIALGVLTMVLVIAYLGIGAYAVSEVTKIDACNLEHAYTPETYGVAYQEVSFAAREDGLQIAAWYLPNPDADAAIIIVHGRDASKQCAATETIVAFQSELYKAGYAVLAIDLRGHADSEGERYSFGVYERRDVLGAVEFLIDKGFTAGKIGVVGLSMGGAAVNGAAAESEAIGAVVTEGTFAEFYPLVEAEWENESGLPNFFLPGVLLMNQVMYGYSIADINPAAEIAAASPRPMLIIHCTEDEMVPVSHMTELQAAAPHAETWVMDNCDHAELHRDYPAAYCDRVISFFDDNL